MADLLPVLILVGASFGAILASVGLFWSWRKWTVFYRKQYWKFWSGPSREALWLTAAAFGSLFLFVHSPPVLVAGMRVVMIKARSLLEKKRRKKVISLAIFWSFIAVLATGFMVMLKESECGSYGQDMAVKNWHLICKDRPRPHDGDKPWYRVAGPYLPYSAYHWQPIGNSFNFVCCPGSNHKTGAP